MSEITLSATQRSVIKAQILAAAKAANPPDLADIRATNRNWSKDQIIAYAERFGVALPPADSDTPANDAPAETPAAPAVAPTISDDAQRDLSALDAIWATMDVTGYRRALVALAERANEPKVTIVQTALPNGSAPPSKRTGTRKAADVFPSLVGHATGNIDLPIYDAPDAPVVDKHFAMPPTLGAILSRTVKRGKGVFLSGPPGTGKSTLVEQIAARLGRPFVRISCNANTDAATLVGMTVPVSGGDTEFQPGILTHAISRPGIVLLIDEPSTARDGILYVLQSLLDDAKRIFVDEKGGMIFPLAPDALVFLADNTDGNGDSTGSYTGTRTLSRALLSRLTTIQCDYMPAQLEARILSARTGCTRQLADMIVEFAGVSRVKTANGELPSCVDFRQLVSWAEYLTDGIEPQAAAEMSFLNSTPSDAREVLQQLLTTHCAPELILKAI